MIGDAACDYEFAVNWAGVLCWFGRRGKETEREISASLSQGGRKIWYNVLRRRRSPRCSSVIEQAESAFPPKEEAFPSLTLRKGLVLFLLLSFGVSAVVLLSSVDGETWSTILRADKRLLLLALVFVLSAWACDASRFCALARAAGEKIDFKLGMVLTWLHYFGCAVTPMQSGGGPFQVYVLYKRKVPLGKGIAITLTRTLLTILILGIVVPVAVFIEPELLRGRLFLKGVFSYVLAFIIISWVLVVLSITRPAIIKRWGRVFTLWLKRFGVVKPERVLKIVKRITTRWTTTTSTSRCSFLRAQAFSPGGSFFPYSTLLSSSPCFPVSSRRSTCRSTTFRRFLPRPFSCSCCTSSPRPGPAVWRKAAELPSSACWFPGTWPASWPSRGGFSPNISPSPWAWWWL